MTRATSVEEIRSQAESFGAFPVWLHAEPEGALSWERYRLDGLDGHFEMQAKAALEAAERRKSGGVLVKR